LSTIQKSKVYISKIIVYNYRTFLDENSLELSPDPVVPITIIHGASGEGKTTLLNAIHWCLYGEEKDKNKIKEELEFFLIILEILF